MINEETSRAVYEGNGITAEFPVPFTFFQNASGVFGKKNQIKVVLCEEDGSEKELDEDADYEVLAESVRLFSVPQTGERIVILRDVPLTQELDMTNQAFQPELLEKSLDKATMQIQELAEQVDRAVKFPVSAANPETNAAEYLERVTSAADAAESSADNAQSSASSAAASATAAANSASAAAESATSAETSKTAAAVSATQAATKAGEAANSATAAATSASAALQSEQNAATSEQNAAASAAEAAKQAGIATTQAGLAKTSADAAEESKDSADVLAQAAQEAKDAAEAAAKHVEEISQGLAAVFIYRGNVTAVADLPANAETGDVYTVGAEDDLNKAEYVWTGDHWEKLGTAVDLSGYLLKSEAEEEYAPKADTELALDSLAQDVSERLTQTQADGLYAPKSTTYSKTQTDTLLAAKQNSLTADQLSAANSGVTSAKVSGYDSHLTNTSNPHNVSKAQVGLGNVDNTSDLDKPVSAAVQTALDLKADRSTTYTKTETDTKIAEAAGNVDLTGYYNEDNLVGGNNIEIVEQVLPAEFDEHTLACWHLDGDFTNAVQNSRFGAFGNRQKSGEFNTNFPKFGSASYEGYSSTSTSDGVYHESRYSFTLDLWAQKYNTNGSGWTSFGFIDNNDSGGFGFKLNFGLNNNLIRLAGNKLVSTVEVDLTDFGINSGDTYFHHYALTYDNQIEKIKLFVDGKQVASADVTPNSTFTEILYFAYRYGNIRVDEVRLSNVVRYTKDFVPPTAPYPIEEKTGKHQINAVIPEVDLSGYIPTSQKGAANGVAALDANAKVPAVQLPDLSETYIPTAQKNASGGVAGLDANGKLSASQIPIDGSSITVDDNGNLKAEGGSSNCSSKNIGEVYFSQSSLATDNSGALPLFTGETIASANTVYPDLYNFVIANPDRYCTSEEYEAALSTYGECAKYATKFPINGQESSYSYNWSEAEDTRVLSYFDFYYEENGQLIPTTSKTFWYERPLSDVTGVIDSPQAYIDQERTKPIVIHKKNTDSSILYNVYGTKVQGTINNEFYLSFAWDIKDQNSDNLTYYLEEENTYLFLFLPYNYAYETVSSTVTTYEPNGSLRLPFLKNYIKCATAADGITQSKAGLPNITGVVDNNSIRLDQAAATSGAFSAENNGRTGVGTSNGSTGTKYTFDASRCSASYGASDTVTPAHTTLYPWVCAYNAAVPASTAQAGQFQEALSGKVDLPSGKTQADIDFVVESYSDADGNWYRKYKSGWIEQGCYQAESTVIAVTLLKPFANANYAAFVEIDGTAGIISISGRTNTGFYINGNAYDMREWYAFGQGAENV